jgi:hypothetical protein
MIFVTKAKVKTSLRMCRCSCGNRRQGDPKLPSSPPPFCLCLQQKFLPFSYISISDPPFMILSWPLSWAPPHIFIPPSPSPVLQGRRNRKCCACHRVAPDFFSRSSQVCMLSKSLVAFHCRDLGSIPGGLSVRFFVHEIDFEHLPRLSSHNFHSTIALNSSPTLCYNTFYFY